MLDWPNVIYAQQARFSRQWLEGELFPKSREMKRIVALGGCDLLAGKRAISIFYQASTRTAGSFAMAMSFLGGRVVFSTDNAREFSSAAKGETLLDAIRVWNCYGPDIIFLRYDRELGAEIAAEHSIVPIINAGDRQPKGKPESPFSGQHPTQGFLDLFTIQELFGHIDGLTIIMAGDLKNGRTVRSLSYLLGKFNNITIYYVSHESDRMLPDVKEYLTRHNVTFFELTDLREVASRADVLYQTRSQTECGANDKRGDGLIVNMELVRTMQDHAIIMHPLPRVDEITPDVDDDHRAVYLADQIKSGLYTRMALIEMILAPKA